MNLHKLFLTNNECYKVGRTITPKGIMVHSTGANNPNIKRYVGPDDGLLGVNQYGNHWNVERPGGRQVCVHAFIGKLKDGTIATYQTLPWNMRAIPLKPQTWKYGSNWYNQFMHIAPGSNQDYPVLFHYIPRIVQSILSHQKN